MKHFLFLQVPHGPCILDLEKHLEALGHRTSRVLFNAGDWLFSRPQNSYVYRKEVSQLREWLLSLHERKFITDIIVYGDCRDIHRIGKQVSQQVGVRFWVLEEGYLRPSWVTLELGGANGYSDIPHKFRQWLPSPQDRQSAQCKIGDKYHFGKTQRYIILWAILYYGSRLFFDKNLNFRYRTHRPNPYIYDYASWHLKVIKRLLGRDYRHRKFCQQFISDESFFFVPLQLVEDSQIAVHSDFNSIHEFIDTVLKSFTECASQDHKLLFKGHPLDSELINYRKYIKEAAKRCGVEKRVFYVHDGIIPDILEKAIGTITVNSTVGLQAIHHACPVICLGGSIYNHSGMTFTGALDQFWFSPKKPDANVYDMFREFLHSHNLVSGGFYRKNASQQLIPQLAEKLSGYQSPHQTTYDSSVIKNDHLGNSYALPQTINYTYNKPNEIESIDSSLSIEKRTNVPIAKKITLLPLLSLTLLTIPFLSIPFLIAVSIIRFDLRDKKSHRIRPVTWIKNIIRN